MNFKRLVLLASTLTLTAALLVFSGCGDETEEKNGDGEVEEETALEEGEVVAVVNGEEITEGELNEIVDQHMEMMEMQMQMGGKEMVEEEMEQMRQQLKPQALDQLIEDVLLYQEVEELGLSVDESEIDAEIQSVKEAQGMDEEMLEEQLEMQGITEEELRSDIEQFLLMEELAKEKVGEEEFQVSEEELKRMYEQQEQQMKMAEKKGMPAEEELDDFEDMKDELEDMASDQILQEHIGQVFQELREDAEIEKKVEFEEPELDQDKGEEMEIENEK